jgi:type I restriction enzyme S subunit
MEYTSIGESCSVVSGGTPSRSKNEYWENGNIPWIKIGNIKSKYVNEYDELITEQGLNNSSAKLLKKGTILYTIFATLGEVGILDIEACTNQAIAGINITDPRITTDYLYYYLKSKKDYVNNIGRGVAQNNINLTTLKNFEIPLIDVDKQLNIVEILEKVERMICLKEKEIDDLDLLIKARFIEMFGDLKSNEKDWDLKTFEEMSVLITDGEHSTPKRTKEGIYLLSARNVLNHSLQLEDVDYINRDEYLRIAKRVVPKKGDILISCSGTIGRCCSIPDSLQLQMVRSVALIRFKEVINPIFAEYMITSDYLQEQINSSKTMSSQANLFQGKIRKLKGFLPPTELQQQFADFVRQVDKSRFDIKKSIIELEREVVYD